MIKNILSLHCYFSVVTEPLLKTSVYSEGWCIVFFSALSVHRRVEISGVRVEILGGEEVDILGIFPPQAEILQIVRWK